MTNEKKFHLGVKALIMNGRKEILVLKANTSKFKDKSKNNIYYWDLPGGRVQEGHGIEETLVREVEEEIGAKDLLISEKFDSFIANTKVPVEDEHFGLILFVYLCELADTEQRFVLNEESSEYKWVPVEEAKRLLAHKYAQSFIKKMDELV